MVEALDGSISEHQFVAQLKLRRLEQPQVRVDLGPVDHPGLGNLVENRARIKPQVEVTVLNFLLQLFGELVVFDLLEGPLRGRAFACQVRHAFLFKCVVVEGVVKANSPLGADLLDLNLERAF